MKRSLFTKFQKGALLMVPTSALMLGAAQAQTTIGLNFQGWYYNSGNTPQTIGYGAGYQTTGFPVTGTAFGVPAANWFNADPLPPYAFSGYATFGGANTTFAGGLTANVTTPDVWESGIGELNAGFNAKPALAETVAPGNDEVTWAYLDDGNNNGSSSSVSVAGLAARFPNGYVIQTVAADAGVTTFDGVDLNDGITDDPVTYSTYYEANNPAVNPDISGGTIGLSTPSVTFTGGTLSINCNPKTAVNRSTLAGFIITDVPVVTRNVPTDILLSSGAQLVLPTPAYIIGVGLQFQWQHAGTNLPGATYSSYTNNSVATTDSGTYSAVVTSSFYPSISVTGQVASVSVVPPHAARIAYWDPAEAGHADDASGIWSYSLVNWWSGSIDDYWGNGDTAVFGAGGTGAYTVTLGDSITASSITFNSGVYTITNSSGQTLTFSGFPALTANTNGTITVPVTMINTNLLKEGTGAVTLSGTLTCTNDVIVGAGTLQVLAVNGDAPYVVSNTATLMLGYSLSSGMSLYGDGTAANTGLYLMGGVNFNVGDTPTLLGAPTTIRQYGSGLASLGIDDINATGLHCTAAASGSIIDANIQMVSDGYGMTLTVDAGANTTTGDLVLNGPLNVGSLGFLKWGTGTLRLNGTATPANRAVNVMGGPVICGVNNCLGTNAVLNVGAYGPSYTPPNATGTSIDIGTTSQSVSNAVIGSGGTLKVAINKGGSPSSGEIICWGQPPTLGGTLVVTNVGGTLALGDTFTLFSVAGSGAFATVQCLSLPNGLALQDNTAVDGTIKVITGSVPPSITTDLTGTTNYAYVGGKCTFAIAASGDPILQYQWKRNGTTVVGSSPILALTSLTAGTSYYSCTVTNNFGQAQSQTNYVVVVTPASAGLEAAAMTQDSPMSLWPLTEANPATAYDYWGGNNGTQTGTLTLGAPGPQPPTDAGFNSGNTAYQFDGASAYIALGTNASLAGTTDFTLEAWINTTNNAVGQIIQQRSSTGYNGEYTFGVNANGTVSFNVFGGGVPQFGFSSPVASKYVNDGNWHHVAAVRSGLTGIIYIDGSAVANSSGTAVAPLDSTIASFIGVDQRANSSYFDGRMCDVAIYGYALSPARIADHAQAGVLGTSPFRLGEVAGGFIQDSKPSGTLHPGLNYGTTWQYTNMDNNSVTRTNVAVFPIGRQIAIPANADFNSPTGTICFWMQMPTPTVGNGTILFDRRTSSGTVMFVDSNGIPNLQTYYGGNFYGGSVADGNWHHVAYTYDQSSSGTQTLYVDGQQVASLANEGAWTWPATQEIELGRSHDTYWQNYNGLMADFRIYSRILNATEVGTIFSANALVDTTTLMVRYNFNTAAGVGTSLFCPVGALQSAPELAPASWTPVPNISAQLPYLAPGGLPVTTNTTLFYRGGF